MEVVPCPMETCIISESDVSSETSTLLTLD